MKKGIFYASILSILVLGSCSKTNKSELVKDSKIYKSVGTEDIDLINNSIPHYATYDVYKQTFETLEAQFNANLSSLAASADTTDSLSDEDYQTRAWLTYEQSEAPLLNFEQAVGFTSKRAEQHGLIKTWIQNQGEEIDTPSYPDKFPISLIDKAMMNSNGNYAIGTDLYHMDENLKVTKITGLDHAEGLDSFVTANKGTGIVGDVVHWLENIDDHILVSTNGDDKFFDDCTCNRQYSIWVQADDKTKYLSRLAWYYDFSKTSGTHTMFILAKIKIVFVHVWVPALTSSKCGYQSFYRSRDCEENPQREYDEGISGYGPLNGIQRNHWLDKFTIRKLAWNADHSYPADGYWGHDKVKDMNTWRWTNLIIP